MLTTLIAAAYLAVTAPAPFALQSAPAIQAEAVPLFVQRVVAEDGMMTVQTAGQRLSAPGRPDVWLMGVVHVGQADYYKEIQALLDAQDLVLYEGVRPSQKQVEAAKAAPADQEKPKGIYHIFGEVIGLEMQNDHISYKNPKWINSDLSWDQMAELSKEDSGAESPAVGMVQQMMDPNSPAATMMNRILQMPLPGMKEAMKVFFVKKLGETNDPKTGLTQDAVFNRVILEERNKAVIADLKKLLEQPEPPKSIGILYGAAHQPAFANYLTEAYGYKVAETKWFSAASANPDALDANGKMMLQILERAGSQTVPPATGGGSAL